MSVPNVAHLEPMRGGCCTVMPYFVGKIVELPLTTAQDYSLFHILNDYSIDLWKQQLELIRRRNGLMSLITHPDYLIERRARNVYESLLDYLRQMLEREKIWAALPGDVDPVVESAESNEAGISRERMGNRRSGKRKGAVGVRGPGRRPAGV